MIVMTPIALLQGGTLPTLAQPTIIAVAVAYFLVVAAIGVWAARRTRSASDFFVAGQGIGLWTMAVAAMAATLSGFAFIGGPGLMYSLGMGAVFIILPIGVSGTLGAWTMAKRIRLLGEARGLITVPDAIAARFNSRLARGLAAVAMLVAIIGYMATNILALGLVIDAIFGSGLFAGLWIGMAITLAYSVSGGILAGVYTDLFQGAVMSVASVLVFLFTLKVGGGDAGFARTILPGRRPVPGAMGEDDTAGGPLVLLRVRDRVARAAARGAQVLHAARAPEAEVVPADHERGGHHLVALVHRGRAGGQVVGGAGRAAAARAGGRCHAVLSPALHAVAPVGGRLFRCGGGDHEHGELVHERGGGGADPRPADRLRPEGDE